MTVLWAIDLMMEPTSTFETSINFYQTTWRYNAEDSHRRIALSEKMDSHEVF
jgi:hypothetical protein